MYKELFKYNLMYSLSDENQLKFKQIEVSESLLFSIAKVGQQRKNIIIF